MLPPTPLAARSYEPSARVHASLTAISGGRLLLFGGRAGPAHPAVDMAVWMPAQEGNPQAPSWHVLCAANPAAAPCPRWKHAAAYMDDAISSTLFVFGGLTHRSFPAGGDAPAAACSATDATLYSLDTELLR